MTQYGGLVWRVISRQQSRLQLLLLVAQTHAYADLRPVLSTVFEEPSSNALRGTNTSRSCMTDGMAHESPCLSHMGRSIVLAHRPHTYIYHSYKEARSVCRGYPCFAFFLAVYRYCIGATFGLQRNTNQRGCHHFPLCERGVHASVR